MKPWSSPSALTAGALQVGCWCSPLNAGLVKDFCWRGVSNESSHNFLVFLPIYVVS